MYNYVLFFRFYALLFCFLFFAFVKKFVCWFRFLFVFFFTYFLLLFFVLSSFCLSKMKCFWAGRLCVRWAWPIALSTRLLKCCKCV